MPKARKDPTDPKERAAPKKRANRCKPYRWDELGEPISDPEGWAKTNQRDKQKSDMMITSGKYNIMPPSLQCDRCKHARWPCIYPRGVPSACCHGCAHSKLRCTRFIDPAPIVVELYKQGYCNMRTPSPSPGLPTPPKTQTPRSDARAPPAPGTATPAATPTPAPALPRILLRAPRPTPVEVAGSSRSASSTEADSIEVEAAVAPRTPVLPRGSAEPSRHLPPLASLSRPPSPRRATSIPTISGPVTPERRPVHSPPSLPSLSQSVTPERRAARTPRPQPSHPATPGTGSRPRPQRPSLSVTTQFCSPLETPLADRPGKDTILLRPEDGRVPFLVPHAHDAADARLVRDLGLSPTYLWRASEPCVACCDEGSSTLFGNVYVPRRGWGVVRAPTCLRCTAADRACQWLLNTGGDLLSTRRLGLVVLDSPGVAGAGVFVKASDLEGWSHAALARALHRGEGDEFDAAWHAALPGLLGTHEQYGLGTPRCDTDAPPVCTSLVLAEDRRHRPALARVVKALRRHDAYDPLLVTDMLRRLPGPEEGADAGLLRAEGEWGAWSFAGGELTLYLRDTPFHAGWDTKELDKLFLGEEPNYQMGKDTPFVLWPPRQMRLPVESIVTRLLNVEYEDMAPAMLYAVECALTGTEMPTTWAHLPRIREGQRALLADDAERGTALYELFRADLGAAEAAVRLAARAPGIIQTS